MRTSDEIKTRLQGLLQAELERRIEGATRRLPERCIHNHRQVLDARKQVAGEVNEGYNRVDRRHLPVMPTIGLCMVGAENPEHWEGNICDDPMDAQRCPLFDPLQTPAVAADLFVQQVRDPEWLQTNLPEVAHLVWTLDAEDIPPVRLPWWRRWLLRLLPPPVEARQPSFDPARLLPGGSDADPRP